MADVAKLSGNRHAQHGRPRSKGLACLSSLLMIGVLILFLPLLQMEEHLTDKVEVLLRRESSFLPR